MLGTFELRLHVIPFGALYAPAICLGTASQTRV